MHNNLYAGEGIQIGYVFPFGNFFEIGYTNTSNELRPEVVNSILQDSVAGIWI